MCERREWHSRKSRAEIISGNFSEILTRKLCGTETRRCGNKKTVGTRVPRRTARTRTPYVPEPRCRRHVCRLVFSLSKQKVRRGATAARPSVPRPPPPWCRTTTVCGHQESLPREVGVRPSTKGRHTRRFRGPPRLSAPTQKDPGPGGLFRRLLGVSWRESP